MCVVKGMDERRIVSAIKVEIEVGSEKKMNGKRKRFSS